MVIVLETLLMSLTQQVVDGLDRIESRQGHFHEDGVPVAHGSIPQTGQLQGFELTAILALAADEACVVVNVIGQMERVTLIVLRGANQVDGVEVGAAREHLHIRLVALVYLTALEDLRTHCAVLVVSQERTAAGLADVLHHAAHAQRTVEFLAQVDDELGILKLFDVSLAAAQLMLHEADNLLEFLMVVLA